MKLGKKLKIESKKNLYTIDMNMCAMENIEK